MTKLLTRTAIQIALFITLATYILPHLFTTGHTAIGALSAIAAIPLFAHAFHNLGRDWNNWRMNRARRLQGKERI